MAMINLMTKEKLKYFIKDYDSMKFIKHHLMNEMLYGELDQVIPEDFKKAILPKGLDAETFGDAYVQKINFKQGQLDEAIEQENWDKVFMLIEKPFRLNWLEENIDLIEDNKKYYDFLKDAYMLTEFPMSSFTFYSDLLELFYAKDYPKLMMNKDELKLLNSLPNEVKIWRGVKVDDVLDIENIGLSFTLNKDKAIWFAKRFSQEGVSQPTLIEAVVKKKFILSIFLDRNEDEVIVNPEDVTIKNILDL
tara:strand:+ start:1173 stop:1919 length:747 start_codon:yes stop_codon:yes gene_type:complete